MNDDQKADLPKLILVSACVIGAAIWIVTHWPWLSLAGVAAVVALFFYVPYAKKRSTEKEQARRNQEIDASRAELARRDAEAKRASAEAWKKGQAETAAKAAQEERERRAKWEVLKGQLWPLAQNAKPVISQPRAYYQRAPSPIEIYEEATCDFRYIPLDEGQKATLDYALRTGPDDPMGREAVALVIRLFIALPNLDDISAQLHYITKLQHVAVRTHPIVAYFVAHVSMRAGNLAGVAHAENAKNDAGAFTRNINTPMPLYLPRRLLADPVGRFTHCVQGELTDDNQEYATHLRELNGALLDRAIPCEMLKACLMDKEPCLGCPHKPAPVPKATPRRGGGTKKGRAAEIEAEPTAPEIEHGRDM